MTVAKKKKKKIQILAVELGQKLLLTLVLAG